MIDDLIVFCLSNIVAKFTIIMKQTPGYSWLKYVNPPWNMLAPSTINDRWDISNQLMAGSRTETDYKLRERFPTIYTVGGWDTAITVQSMYGSGTHTCSIRWPQHNM